MYPRLALISLTAWSSLIPRPALSLIHRLVLTCSLIPTMAMSSSCFTMPIFPMMSYVIVIPPPPSPHPHTPRKLWCSHYFTWLFCLLYVAGSVATLWACPPYLQSVANVCQFHKVAHVYRVLISMYVWKDSPGQGRGSSVTHMIMYLPALPYTGDMV